MRGKQAKILSVDNLDDLLLFAETSRHPSRNKVIVLLSAKAGLRAGEIAYLTWAMVTDPNGDIGTVLELPDCAAKKGSGRVIPLHEDLRTALAVWRAAAQSAGPVIVSERGGPMTPLSIVVWFANAYRLIGVDGCSSHSGRRTFITRCPLRPSRRWLAARRAAVGWPSVDPNDRALHRRRYRCPAQARRDDLTWLLRLPTPISLMRSD
jgi:integrase